MNLLKILVAYRLNFQFFKHRKYQVMCRQLTPWLNLKASLGKTSTVPALIVFFFAISLPAVLTGANSYASAPARKNAASMKSNGTSSFKCTRRNLTGFSSGQNSEEKIVTARDEASAQREAHSGEWVLMAANNAFRCQKLSNTSGSQRHLADIKTLEHPRGTPPAAPRTAVQ